MGNVDAGKVSNATTKVFVSEYPIAEQIRYTILIPTSVIAETDSLN